MYNTLISLCARKGELHRAEWWLGRMLELGAKADVASYSAVVHACAKSSDIPRAESWVKRMQEEGVTPNVVTYNSVINACARCAKAERAEYWFDQMKAKEVAPGILTYNSMINACAKAGDVVGAEKWLKAIKAAGLEPDGVSYSTVVHACSSAQEPMRAEQCLVELRAASPKSLSDDQPVAFCYNSVVQAWARRGDAARASKWMTIACDMHMEVTAASFGSLITALQKAGNQEEAQQWANSMEMRGLQGPRSTNSRETHAPRQQANRTPTAQSGLSTASFGTLAPHGRAGATRRPARVS